MTIRAGVAFATVALLAQTAAAAGPTMTTANVNLRAGAGVGHARIATLQRGTEVSIDHCRDEWCLVETRGISGWIALRYVVGVGGGATGIVERYDPPVVRAPPVATFDFVVPRTAHEIGNSHHHRPRRNFHDTRR